MEVNLVYKNEKEKQKKNLKDEFNKHPLHYCGYQE